MAQRSIHTVPPYTAGMAQLDHADENAILDAARHAAAFVDATPPGAVVPFAIPGVLVADVAPTGADARYQVAFGELSVGAFNALLTVTAIAGGGPRDNTVVATNLAERAAGTHNLAVDGTQPVKLEFWRDVGGTLHPFFTCRPPVSLGWIEVTDTVAVATAIAPAAGKIYDDTPPNVRERVYLARFAGTYTYPTLLGIRVEFLSPTLDDSATGGTSGLAVEACLLLTTFTTAGVTWGTLPTFDAPALAVAVEATAGGAPTTLQVKDDGTSSEHSDAISDVIGGGTFTAPPAGTYYGIGVRLASAFPAGTLVITQAEPTMYVLPHP